MALQPTVSPQAEETETSSSPKEGCWRKRLQESQTPSYKFHRDQGAALIKYRSPSSGLRVMDKEIFERGSLEAESCNLQRPVGEIHG